MFLCYVRGMVETIAWVVLFAWTLPLSLVGAYFLGKPIARYVVRRPHRGQIEVDCPKCWRRVTIDYYPDDLVGDWMLGTCRCGNKTFVGVRCSWSREVAARRSYDLAKLRSGR